MPLPSISFAQGLALSIYACLFFVSMVYYANDIYQNYTSRKKDLEIASLKRQIPTKDAHDGGE